MATELFTANRATTTVSSGGTDAPSGGSSETWTVASSVMFGAASTGVSQFHVADPAAPSEVMAVTNVSGTTWTVTRGAESTIPVAHAAGFVIYQVATAGFLSSPSFSGTVQAGAGVTPVTPGFTSFATGGAANLLNTASGTSVGPAAGTFYYAALWIPFNVTLTGVILTIGTTGGTDKWVVALWSGSGGAALANSATAGTNVATGPNVKQAFPFTGTVPVAGPGSYIIGVQSNGTTAKFLAFASALEGFVTGSVAGSFGTVPSLTPASTYTLNVGPFATTY